MVLFADSVNAQVVNACISNTFEDGPATTDGLVARWEQMRRDITEGRVKGRWNIPPRLVDDVIITDSTYVDGKLDWNEKVVGKRMKDLRLEVLLAMHPGTKEEGEQRITLEAYVSSGELACYPLTQIIRRITEVIRFEDLRPYCEVFPRE